MRGIYHIIVQNRYLKYEFDIRRNITIIQGDSATGKTTLVSLIREYMLDGVESGVTISCECECKVVEGNRTWQNQLAAIKDSIVFIDEGNSFIASKDFAREVQKGENYFVLVTREGLESLPYSVTEIYGIKSSGKYGRLEAVYHELYQIYNFNDNVTSGKTILVEDGNSGYEFFSVVASEQGLNCISAKGKSNIFNIVSSDDADDMLVIADGAAFGSQIRRVMNAIEGKNVQLYLPESFEWLILNSSIFNDNKIKQILEDTSNFVDSREFFSWERFFTQILVDNTKDTYMAYSKQKLNEVYLHEKNKRAIIEVMPI
ncbi:MAG: translation initiation factor 2 [Selenomonadaceae bacterium]|nr:translation initiation factor 2 [Selenomonadaceae bacterium]